MKAKTVNTKPKKRIWLRWLLAVLMLLLAGGWWMAQRVDLRISDRELSITFKSNMTPIAIHRYKVKDRKVRFVEFGRDSLPVTILVHGAPSSLSFFNSLYADTALTNHTMLVGVDRPGYGYSGFGKSVISVKEQARILQPLISHYARQGRKVNLAASSYGGAVIAKLAMDNPNKVGGILFISSSLAPGEEHTYPISYVIDSPWFGWFFPTILRVANDEKLHHRQALEDIEDGWGRIKARIIMLHGNADQLIY
ncbi:alpha/beta fold hydrolase, partial [Persicitalea sp.]|uniref:alpha/beta fold hydrolase n=1 Tax=Persicitalea sp. TaxID=3100273 RepID=UPI003593EB24